MASLFSAPEIISLVVAFVVFVLVISLAAFILGNVQSSTPNSIISFQITNESDIVSGNQTIVALNVPAGGTLTAIISIQNISTLVPSDQYNITGNGVGIMFNGSYRST